MITEVTVKFKLESLQPLNAESIDSQVGEYLAGTDENWLQNSPEQALINLNSLEVSVKAEE